MSQKAAAFLAELREVYERHGLFLSHQDENGAFQVIRLGETNSTRRKKMLNWLASARIDIQTLDDAAVGFTRCLYERLRSEPRNLSKVFSGLSDAAVLSILDKHGVWSKDTTLVWLRLSCVLAMDMKLVPAGGRLPLTSANIVVTYRNGDVFEVLKNGGLSDVDALASVPNDLRERTYLLRAFTGVGTPFEPRVEILEE